MTVEKTDVYERRAVVTVSGWDGDIEYSAIVVGETDKRYQVIMPGLGWVGADNTWLVPKGAVRFKEGVCTKSHS